MTHYRFPNTSLKSRSLGNPPEQIGRDDLQDVGKGDDGIE